MPVSYSIPLGESQGLFKIILNILVRENGYVKQNPCGTVFEMLILTEKSKIYIDKHLYLVYNMSIDDYLYKGERL